MSISLIKTVIILTTIICVLVMVYRLRHNPQEKLLFTIKVKLCISGIKAFMADTLGVGRFAVNVTLAKVSGYF